MMKRYNVKLLTVWMLVFVLTGCSGMVVSTAPATIHSDNATTGATGVSAVDRLIAKGDAQRRQGHYQQAAATLERALRLSPGSGGAYLALSRVRLDQKNYGEALQLAEKSLSLAGDSKIAQKEAWLVISKVKRSRGDLQGANEAARKAK